MRPNFAGGLMAGALCLAAGVGGCSFFSHSVSWTKPGVTSDQAQSDLASCTEVAQTQTDQDRSIDQDIAAANSGSNQIDQSPLQNMQAYKHENRYKSVLEDCMAQLGYSKVD